MFGVIYCVLLTLDHSRDYEGIHSRISPGCLCTELSAGEISHATYAPYCPKAGDSHGKDFGDLVDCYAPSSLLFPVACEVS